MSDGGSLHPERGLKDIYRSVVEIIGDHTINGGVITPSELYGKIEKIHNVPREMCPAIVGVVHGQEFIGLGHNNGTTGYRLTKKGEELYNEIKKCNDGSENIKKETHT